MLSPLAYPSGGKNREQIDLLKDGDNTKALWSLNLELLLPTHFSLLFLLQTSFKVILS